MFTVGMGDYAGGGEDRNRDVLLLVLLESQWPDLRGRAAL